MSRLPSRTPSSWSASVTGTSSSGSRRRSRQWRAHLSGVAPVTKPMRSVSVMGPSLGGGCRASAARAGPVEVVLVDALGAALLDLALLDGEDEVVAVLG